MPSGWEPVEVVICGKNCSFTFGRRWVADHARDYRGRRIDGPFVQNTQVDPELRPGHYVGVRENLDLSILERYPQVSPERWRTKEVLCDAACTELDRMIKQAASWGGKRVEYAQLTLHHLQKAPFEAQPPEGFWAATAAHCLRSVTFSAEVTEELLEDPEFQLRWTQGIEETAHKLEQWIAEWEEARKPKI